MASEKDSRSHKESKDSGSCTFCSFDLLGRTGEAMKKKIILVEDLEHWGKAGDLVEVSPGFARNFLIPTKKAILATYKNLKATEHQRKLIKEKQNKLKRETEKLAKILEGLIFSFERESGEEEKI